MKSVHHLLCGRNVRSYKDDAIHNADPVYSQFHYIEHKAGLVLCILKLAIHRAGEISLYYRQRNREAS